MILYELPCKPWEVVSADIFVIKDKMLLYSVDYYSKFSIVKMVGSLTADDLVQMAKMRFAKYGLPKKIISDTGTNFTSETSRQFCRQISIQHSITSSHHHQGNG